MKDDGIVFKKGKELFEYMLENAEISFEEGLGNDSDSYFELESGLRIHFDENDELIDFEIP